MIDIQASGGGSGIDSYDGSLDEFTETISSFVDALSPQLRRISLEIHDHPELRYKEVHAHEVLTGFIEQQSQRGKSWSVTPSAYGIGTAFVAVFDSGKEGPVVSFNAEYGMC